MFSIFTHVMKPDTNSEPGLPVWKRGCKSSFHVPDVTPLGGTEEELGIHLDC